MPPLDAERLRTLVGRKCAVASKANPRGRRWWVEVVEVRFVNSKDALVRVAGHRMFGGWRWVGLSEVRWK